MSTILSMPPEPSRPDPSPLPPIQCKVWCVDGTGHGDAVHEAEQRCRSVVHRLDAILGGGRDDDQTATSYASLIAQAEKPAVGRTEITIGIELGGTEQWLTLTLAETIAAIAYLRHLIDEALAD